MRIFHCDHCGNALFFENITCLQCGSDLAFLPDRLALSAIEQAGEPGLWRRRARGIEPSDAPARRYRLCSHHAATQSCNFAVPEDDPNPLCVSCRQTRILPDLSVPQNRSRWYRIEVAKRRLFFTLSRLGLVDPDPPAGTVQGPSYQFLEDQPDQQVMTGHSNGVITLNVAEADDDERVRRRLALHEPYRTLLGHLRHESGHYYWDVLIDQGQRHEAFRQAFGDERENYGQSLKRHYSEGPPPEWSERYVSAYATAHAWEDWAETWAHYLHMVDLLETASSFNMRLAVPGSGGPVAETVENPFSGGPADFDALVQQWVPVTVVVNSLTRSLGQEDAYPFALSPGAMEKLRFVHDIVRSHREGI